MFVLYTATGNPPWSEFTNNLAALFHVANSEKPPPFPDKLSTTARTFLGRCLVVDAKGRSMAKDLLLDPFVSPEVSRYNRQGAVSAGQHK